VHARLFMSFIHGKFGEDEEILCPCSRCLNQNYQHQALVERHILMNGMESTYTRWIHHGENLDVYGLLNESGMTEDNSYDDGNLMMMVI
jgi:hypothetical protein